MKSNNIINRIVVIACLFSVIGMLVSCNFDDINAPKYQVSEEDLKGDNYNLGAFFP